MFGQGSFDCVVLRFGDDNFAQDDNVERFGSYWELATKN
jgi:hypothetical protein